MLGRRRVWYWEERGKIFGTITRILVRYILRSTIIYEVYLVIIIVGSSVDPRGIFFPARSLAVQKQRNAQQLTRWLKFLVSCCSSSVVSIIFLLPPLQQATQTARVVVGHHYYYAITRRKKSVAT